MAAILYILKPHCKIHNNAHPEIPVWSAQSFIAQCPSSSMHRSLTAIRTSAWTDTHRDEQWQLTLISFLSACTHLVTVQYSRAQSPQHRMYLSMALLCIYVTRNCHCHKWCCSTLHTSIFKWVTNTMKQQMKCVCLPVHIPPSDGNIHKYMPHAFECIQGVSGL